ncbi:MAG: protein kinase [Pirellulaceae bacterium]|nr:protein kinase [Pirellulaceae bacterium]
MKANQHSDVGGAASQRPDAASNVDTQAAGVPSPAETLAPGVSSPAQTIAPTDTGTGALARSQPDTTGPDVTRVAVPSATAASSHAVADGFDVTRGPVQVEPGSTPAPPADGATRQFDDYEILGELGRGGMGVVYRAREISTQRIVCVKMMLGGFYASLEARNRFRIETEAAAQLDHPNIVPIYRAGEVDGIPYFVMKYVDGQGLDQVPRDHFRNNPREAVALMSKLCRAVHFAHARGILHRDLKPANVLVDADGQPHVTDFGLAKRIDDDTSQTRTGVIMGTPDYMSPEQAIGRNDLVTVTSDVYSLGSMLFDLLTGQPPFKSATVIETLTRVTKEPARMPTVCNARIGRDLETICLKCLEKDPNKRFRSAASLADELDRYLRGEPIESRPVSSAERLWRWCGRNPVLAGLSAALLALLVISAIGSSVAAYQFNLRRKDAVSARAKAEQAQQLADQNAVIADQQRTLALDTLHALVTQVETKLRDRADLADLQAEILSDALEGLQEVSRTAANAGRADRTIGVAYQRMADILEKLGKSDEAVQQHRQALAIFERLLADDPTAEWARWNAAISYDKLGDRSLGTDAAEAGRWYRKATALREDLAAGGTEEAITPVMRQHALAISAARVGGLALSQGDPTEARTYFRKALEQSEAMLRADANNRQAQMAVAGSCSLLGNVSFRLGAQEDAHQYFHRALEMRQAIYQQDPQSVNAKDLLAKSYDALGDFELQTGQTRDAHDCYQDAVKLLEELLAQDPSNAAVKGSLATLQYKLATALLRMDRGPEANAIYAQCLTLREELSAADPEDPQSQIALMLAHARCGHHQQAAALAGRLQQQAADNPGTLFYVACGYALSAGAVRQAAEAAASPSDDLRQLPDQYAASALEALTTAVRLGYRDVVALETDPDLEPIRQLPAFTQLIAGLKS